MPLIIHPSSCCDVCLEPLTYDEPRPPFAIPCGHIFCRECLYTMHPSVCPLCRKPFIPDRSKKLITGEGEEEDKTAIELLQRLVVSWDTDMTEEQRVALVTEIEAYLGAGNTHEPLSKAHEMFRAYHTLKSEHHDGRRFVRQLRRELKNQELHHTMYQENASAVEQSLLTQVQELHSKIAQYETEIESLRQSRAIAYQPNPLPHPPEPYPLEKLPPSFRNRYANGHANENTQTLSTQTILDPPQRVFDAKGKGRAVLESPSEHNIPHRPVKVSPVPPEENASISGIIPGASPSRRFVPVRVYDAEQHGRWPDTESDPRPLSEAPVDPSAMVEQYLAEYVNGFEQGYRAMQPQPSSGRRRHHVSRPRTAGPGPVSSPLLDPPAEGSSSSSSRPRPSRAMTLEEVMETSRNSPAEWHRSSRPRQSSPLPPGFVPSSSTMVTNGTHALSLYSTMTEPASHPLPPPPASAPALSSSFSINEATSSHSTNGTTRGIYERQMSDRTNWHSDPQVPSVPGSSLRRRSALSVTSLPASVHNTPAGADSRRTSVSSWGTVNTLNPAPPETQPIRGDAHFIPADDIISVRDLQLRSFEDVAADGMDRGPAYSSTDTLHTTLLFSSPDEYLDLDQLSRTPRNRPLSLSESESTLPPLSQSRDSESHRDTPPPISRDWNHAELAPTPRSSHPHSRSGSTSHRSSRTRRHQISQPTAVQDNSSLAHVGYNYFSPVPDASNALGLSDIVAPSPQPHISAPAPIAPGHRAFLRSFSYDGY